MRPQSPARPLLIVVSAPSGAGKTTLCDRLLAERGDVVYSVSCTTRLPRGAEVDGQDYHFLSEQEFQARVKRGEFLEHATVHGHHYGTLRRTVEEALRAGRAVLMDIDVQGAARIRDQVQRAGEGDILKQGWVDIFVAPPSMEALRERLEKRGEDSAEEIQRRLRNAVEEMHRSGEYKYVLVNDNLDSAYARLAAIVDREGRF